MKLTSNSKSFSASKASNGGAFMGTSMSVPVSTNVNKPTPSFKAPVPGASKSAPSFKTNK